jgi:hypothetical protein
LIVTLTTATCAPPDDLGRNAAGPSYFEGSVWWQREQAAVVAYAATPITLRGRVLDHRGQPLAGAAVIAGSLGAITDATGAFVLPSLSRKNVLLDVNREGFRREHVPVLLMRAAVVTEVMLDPILLSPSSRVRTLFGGDVSLGRRFVDPDENTRPHEWPADHPMALIKASDPLPGTKAVMNFLVPLFSEPDFASVNLETVVTDTPSTPATDNTFVFYTLPGSLPALPFIGIDHVTLANNHIYDYFDLGVSDTIRHLNAARIPHSGAGQNATEAFAAYRKDVRGLPLSMVSLVSIEGIRARNSTGATDTRPGAADLNNDNLVRAALVRERDAGRLPIATVHTGYEYTEEPPPDGITAERLAFLSREGAALVIAHHPHVPQGFAIEGGILIAHSLGNLSFDQERLDTMFGMAVSVDWEGPRWVRARGIGLYNEDFITKHVAGALHDLLLRRLASSSRPWGTRVVPYGEAVWVSPNPDDFVMRERALTVEVWVDARGFGIVDLRPHLVPGESLSSVQSLSPVARVRLGRDIMGFGDMEDMDVDEDAFEISRWYVAGPGDLASSFKCQHASHRGAMALCSLRFEETRTEARLSFRNRIRVLGDKVNLPNKEMTLVAWVSGDNAGLAHLDVTYHASFGEKNFGEQRALSVPGGTYPWTLVAGDLTMPPDAGPRDPKDPFAPEMRTDNARSLRVFARHGPPARGEAIFRIDDVAVVVWQEDATPTIATPHPRDLLRVEAAPGRYPLSIKLARWMPRAAAPLVPASAPSP